MRPIDADELKNTIKIMQAIGGNFNVLDVIDNAETVEIPTETRLQGRWNVRGVTDSEGDPDGYELYCSNCGKVLVHLLNRFSSIEEASKHMKDSYTNFCSRCGADMRGEEGDT